MVELFLRSLLRADVAIEDGEAVVGREGADLEPGHAAVRPFVMMFGRDRLAFGERLDEQPPELALAKLRRLVPEHAADDVRARPIGEPQTLRADFLDAEIAIDEEKTLADELQQLARLGWRRQIRSSRSEPDRLLRSRFLRNRFEAAKNLWISRYRGPAWRTHRSGP